MQQQNPPQHKHAEAFCHMTYFGQDAPTSMHITELKGAKLPPIRKKIMLRIWNSRDGVTPFITYCKEYGLELQHVNWQQDVYDPDYKPKRGDLVWITHTEETAQEVAQRSYELYKKELAQLEKMSEAERTKAWGGVDPLPAAREVVRRKARYIEKIVRDLVDNAQPHLILVNKDWE